MKKNISIWMPGGVGGGHYSQGIPVIAKLVDDLSTEYIVNIYSLNLPNADFQPNGYRLFSINKAIRIGWLRWILLSLVFLKHHFKKKYDALYAFWGFPAGVLVVLLSKIIRRPSIIHLQGGDAVYISSLSYGSLRGFFMKLMIWSYNNCSILIALTHFQKDKLIEAGVSRSIDVIPFGPDLDLFQRKEKVNLHSPIRFLHVGNLLPVKDQITLLNSFALISKSIPSELRIIGEDHLHGLIQNHCKELSLQNKVEFMGIQPYDRMSLHYDWANILLMTSVYEGQCLALSEAAATGVMIAGTRVGLLFDWNDHSAVVVEIGNAELLAEKVIHVINNQEVMHKLVENAWNEVNRTDRRWTFVRISYRINEILNLSIR